MFNRLLNLAKRNKDIVGPVATGAALNAGLTTLAAGPAAGLAYGIGDLAMSYPATLGARALGSRIKKPIAGIDPVHIRSGLETTANIGASLGSMVVTDAVAGNLLNPQPVPINASQEQQIMQEMAQRAALNNLDVQAVAPGTQFQTAGIEFLQNYIGRTPQSNLQQYLDPGSLALLREAGVRSYG